MWPADGAEDVASDTTLRLRFDKPIDPRTIAFDWTEGGFLDVGGLVYDAENLEVALPVRLLAGSRHRLNIGDKSGFRTVLDADGRVVSPRAWEFSTRPTDAAENESPPALRSLDPPSGSEVPRLTFVTAEFDRPPDLSRVSVRLVETRRSAGESPTSSTDIEAPPLLVTGDAGRRVTIPVVFPPGWEGDLRIRFGDAEPIDAAYSITEELFDREHPAVVGAPDSADETRAVVERARTARREMRSASVSTTSAMMLSSVRIDRDAVLPFARLDVREATFGFQGDEQFYADVSGWMRAPFAIGSDGDSCWFLRGDRRAGKGVAPELTSCAFDEIHEKHVCVADAFAFDSLDLDEVIDTRRLSLVGAGDLGGAACHVIRAWEIQRIGSGGLGDRLWLHVTDWWIDTRAHLPRRVVRYFSGGSKQVTDFEYTGINRPTPLAAFQAPNADRSKPVDLGPLGVGYDKRFLKISDGSNGRISGRWGKSGERGRSSSGLN